MGRVLDIAFTAIELRGEVWDVARSSKQVHDEISHLAGELTGFAHMLTDLSDRVERLHYIVEQPETDGDWTERAVRADDSRCRRG